jgi:hypothetical protein
VIPIHNTDWALLVLLLLGGLGVYLKVSYPGRFQACWVGIRNLRPMHQFYRPEQPKSDPFLFWLETMTLLLLPMTLLIGMRLSKESSLSSSDWSTYLLLVLAFAALQLLQYVGLLTFGWALGRGKQTVHLLYFKRFSLRWSSFVLLPVNFVALFALDGRSWSGWLLMGLLVAIYAYSVGRALLRTPVKKPLHIGLLFYYLCGLEITPLWALINWGAKAWFQGI